MNASESLSQHFSEEEFLRSETAKELGINNSWEKPEHKENAKVFLQKLETEVRSLFGPLKITSGYRCEKLNDAVGGEKNSYHRLGRAGDITPVQKTIEMVWKHVNANWNGGAAINRKKNFIHLDDGPKRRWFYR